MVFVKTNTAVDNATTARDDEFVKVKKGESITIRKLPALEGSNGRTMYKQVLHFKLKDPNSDDGKRGIALGCGKYHGDGTCLICDVVDVFKNSDDPNEKKLTKYPDGIHANSRIHMPVLVATGDGEGGFNYSDPKLFTLPEASANAINEVNSEYENNGVPLIEDPEFGQNIIVKNPSEPGKYIILPTSQQVPLLDIKPDVEAKMSKDVMKQLDTKVWNDAQVEECLRHSIKEIDWDYAIGEARG